MYEYIRSDVSHRNCNRRLDGCQEICWIIFTNRISERMTILLLVNDDNPISEKHSDNHGDVCGVGNTLF